MRIEVLGCAGGETRGSGTTAFLIDGRVALDAGSITHALSLDQQAAIEVVCLSHVHLDHVRDLPLLADNLFGIRGRPLEVVCCPATAKSLREHLFNDVLWPDFFELPNPHHPQGHPILEMRVTMTGDLLYAAGLEIETVAVQHPVACRAHLVRDVGGTFAFSADTGPTVEFWRVCAARDDLRVLVVDVSFPNELEELARLSGHLTPALLGASLQGFDRDVPIRLYHSKPEAVVQLQHQVAALGDERVSFLVAGETLSF